MRLRTAPKVFANGKKPTFLANDVESVFGGGETADLYVSIRGSKVIFSLVQAHDGRTSHPGGPHSPKNVHLVVNSRRGTSRVFVEGFARPVRPGSSDGKGLVYAKSKHIPDFDPDEITSLMVKRLQQHISDAILTSKVTLKPASYIAKALNELGVSIPGITDLIGLSRAPAGAPPHTPRGT